MSRTSADGTGKNGTWGPIVVVANETGHTLGNPSPVVDVYGSGRVFCHFARDNYGAFVAHSDDDGKSWSPRTALDVKVPGSGWYGSGVGGGVAVEIKSVPAAVTGTAGPRTAAAKGRTVAASMLMILAEERIGPSFNSVPVVSTDSGVHWQRGAFLNDPNNATHGLGEPSVAIVPGNNNGHLIMSGRGARGPAFISWSQSMDAGKSWAQSRTIPAVTSPGCQAPIIGTRTLGPDIGRVMPQFRSIGGNVSHAACFPAWGDGGKVARFAQPDILCTKNINRRAGPSCLPRGRCWCHNHQPNWSANLSSVSLACLACLTEANFCSNVLQEM